MSPKPRVSDERLTRMRPCTAFIDPPSAAQDVIDVIDDLRDARAELAAMRDGLAERITERDMAEMEVKAMRPVVQAAREVLDGVDNWNAQVQSIIGRQVDYDWGGLERLRAALDTYERGQA